VKADRAKWEAHYRAGDRPHDGPPSGLLRRWLPRARPDAGPGVARTASDVRARPRALDVATGLGRNALYLAAAGYEVDAVDISETALREAARRARRAGLRGIRWITADLDRWRPARARYDVVVNAFFLNRRLFPALRAAVRPGGLLMFETHLAGANDAGRPGRRRRLRPGELRRVLNGWEVLYAQDGVCRDGGRRLALGRIVARRPERRRGHRGPGARGRDAARYSGAATAKSGSFGLVAGVVTVKRTTPAAGARTSVSGRPK
jgi:SAM-dependent methyltransferase